MATTAQIEANRIEEMRSAALGLSPVSDHAQRAWLWPAPQSGALDVGKAPLGPCLSSERLNMRQTLKVTHTIFLQPNRAFPGARAYCLYQHPGPAEPPRVAGPEAVGLARTNGKQVSRLNSYKNGSRSRTLMPGLPHENPDRIQQCTEQYLDELQPRDAAEFDLVHQMARLSLAVERAERMEISHMAERVNQATKTAPRRAHRRAAEGRPRAGPQAALHRRRRGREGRSRPPRGDDPAQIVDDLEATSVGCRWLLERWQEYRALLDRHVKWDEPVLLRFFRLQGKEVVEAAFNGPLNAIFLPWDVLVPDYAKEAWKFFRDDWPMSRPDDSYWRNFREIADRPADTAQAWGLLYGIVIRHVERLTKLLAERLDLESVPDPDWTDRAAMDLSREFERHRRHQSAKARELPKTIEAFCKLRKAFAMRDGDLRTPDDR